MYAEVALWDSQAGEKAPEDLMPDAMYVLLLSREQPNEFQFICSSPAYSTIDFYHILVVRCFFLEMGVFPT